ncbi:MAG: 8-oxo-dGTP diphosphatase [Lachnospiraceae bacterium]|nr:8-oxo-dGTP diphosphatase [Lachnospiraceae bacterium]
MRKTTQCYICRKQNNGEEILMLYRNKKPDDPNEGKWLGIGGKLEPGETPEEANIREVYEETGIRLEPDACHFHGIIQFFNTVCEDEEIYLYSVNVPENTEYIECDEGELHWIARDKILGLNMWAGDKVFLEPLIAGKDRINLALYYEGDNLVKVSYDSPAN